MFDILGIHRSCFFIWLHHWTADWRLFCIKNSPILWWRINTRIRFTSANCHWRSSSCYSSRTACGGWNYSAKECEISSSDFSIAIFKSIIILFYFEFCSLCIFTWIFVHLNTSGITMRYHKWFNKRFWYSINYSPSKDGNFISPDLVNYAVLNVWRIAIIFQSFHL